MYKHESGYQENKQDVKRFDSCVIAKANNLVFRNSADSDETLSILNQFPNYDFCLNASSLKTSLILQ
jgi:FPC/CPF motif-containing protein YcgG